MALPPVLTAVYRDVVPLSSLVEPWAPGAAVASELGWCACTGPRSVADALAATLASSLPPAHVAASGTVAAVVQAAIGHILTAHPAAESWQKSGHVLARGFRLGLPPAATGGGGSSSVPPAAGVVHQRNDNPAVDYFVSSALCDVVAAVQAGGYVSGARWLWALLTCPDVAVFAPEARARRAGGGGAVGGGVDGHDAGAANLRQVSGWAMDELVLRMLTGGGGGGGGAQQPAPLLAPPPPTPPVARAATSGAVVAPLPGSWLLPRNDAHIRAICKALPPAPSGSAAVQCVSVYHCRTFANRPGLPSHHALSCAVRAARSTHASPPAAAVGGTVRSMAALASLLAPTDTPPRCDWRAAGGHLARRIFRTSTLAHEVAVLNKAAEHAAARTAEGSRTAVPDAWAAALGEVARRHASCPYGLLLSTHCPTVSATGSRAAGAGAGAGATASPSGSASPTAVSAAAVGAKRRRPGHTQVSTGPTPPLDEPAALHALAHHAVPHAGVVAFVHAVALHCIPAGLWGDRPTQRRLLDTLATWVRMTATERLRVDDVMTGVATRSFVGSDGKPLFDAPHAQRWCLWLVLGFAAPLLRTHLYATTSESSQHATVYYRKAVWAHIVTASVKVLAHRLQLTALRQEDVARLVASRTRGGLSFARLVVAPKRTGVRPIADLSSRLLLPLVAAVNRSAGTPGAAAPGRLAAASLPPARSGSGPAGSTLSPPAAAASAAAPPPLPRSASGPAPSTAGAGASGGGGGADSGPQYRLAARSINQVLQPLYDVLAYNYGRDAAQAGSAIAGLDGFHATLRRLMHVWTLRGGDVPSPLFAVAADISGAFDSVRQDLMCDIATRLLPASAESYCIHRYAIIQPPLSGGGGGGGEEVMVAARGGAQRRVRVRWHRIACRAGEAAFATASFAARASKLRGAVFVDAVEPQTAQRGTLLTLLQQHLTWHLVRAPGQRYYHQSHGIPQGSLLSTMLCNLYLGHYERHVLLPALVARLQATHPTFFGADAALASGHALLRLTDDFLLLTPHQGLAEAFVHALLTTGPLQGLQLSAGKTKVSWWSPALEAVLGPAARAAASPLIAWCGFLVDVRDGSVTTDHSRYAAAGALVNSNTVWTIGAGERYAAFLVRLLRGALRVKSHALLFDAALQPPRVVAANAFQAAYVSVAKWAMTLRMLQRHNPFLRVRADPLLRALARLPMLLTRLVAHRRSHATSVLAASLSSQSAATPTPTPTPSTPHLAPGTLLLGPNAAYRVHQLAPLLDTPSRAAVDGPPPSARGGGENGEAARSSGGGGGVAGEAAGGGEGNADETIAAIDLGFIAGGGVVLESRAMLRARAGAAREDAEDLRDADLAVLAWLAVAAVFHVARGDAPLCAGSSGFTHQLRARLASAARRHVHALLHPRADAAPRRQGGVRPAAGRTTGDEPSPLLRRVLAEWGWSDAGVAGGVGSGGAAANIAWPRGTAAPVPLLGDVEAPARLW